jgi:hypothetical protein
VLARSLPQAHAVSRPASQPVSGSVSPPTGFEASAFSAARRPARLTESRALQIITNAGWRINLASDVQAQCMGWTTYSMSYRTPTGKLQPYGYRDAWVVTASGPGVNIPDPGAPYACPAGRTCPWSQPYHHAAFIVDDKAGQLIITRAF